MRRDMRLESALGTRQSLILSSDRGAFIIFILIACVSRPLSTIRTDKSFSKVYVLLL